MMFLNKDNPPHVLGLCTFSSSTHGASVKVIKDLRSREGEATREDHKECMFVPD